VRRVGLAASRSAFRLGASSPPVSSSRRRGRRPPPNLKSAMARGDESDQAKGGAHLYLHATRQLARYPSASGAVAFREHPSAMAIFRWIQTELCRLAPLLSGLGLALGLMSQAAATCRSPRNVCEHISGCVYRNLGARNQVERTRILNGVAIRDGAVVDAGAEACQRKVGNIAAWKRDSEGCTSAEYLNMATALRMGGQDPCRNLSGDTVRWQCVNRGSGKSYGEIAPDGNCIGFKQVDALCYCGPFTGQVSQEF
jgi:hypothetical protein